MSTASLQDRLEAGHLGFFVDSDWTGDTGPSQATVSIWVFTQVLLVVVLSIVERLGLSNFCRDRTKTFLCKYLKEAEEINKICKKLANKSLFPDYWICTKKRLYQSNITKWLLKDHELIELEIFYFLSFMYILRWRNEELNHLVHSFILTSNGTCI